MPQKAHNNSPQFLGLKRTRGRFYRPLVPTAAKTTSNQIATYKTTAGNYSVTYSYSYDDRGNITSVTYRNNQMTEGDNSHTTTYVYDSQDQLIRENNEDENYTHTWTYNAGGNITQRNRYSYTSGELDENGGIEVAYEYPAVTDPENNTVWGDLLTGYGTKTVTYDEIGNPETFGARAYTWEHGRQLKSLSQGTTTWDYTYDANAMRTGRSNGTATYEYVYNGSQLTQMKKGTETLTFTYDASGIPLTVTHGSNKYYYATNLQGDVVAILNAAGSAVAGYTYDAWGNCTVTAVSSIAELNPLRYCGYVYDQETKLYYLQSRYYDPEVGRFINADSLVATGQGFVGNNIFAYCINNPVRYIDESGFIPQAVEDKMVHDAVLEQICSSDEDLSWVGTCIYYNGKNFWGGWGFCDLYNKKTGEVWELKKQSNSRSCQTAHARLQLGKYVRGRLKNNLDLELKLPSVTTISGGTFSFTTLEGYIYHVTYWNEGNGVLRYSYTKEKTTARKIVEVVALAVVVTTVIVAAVPVGAGAGVGIGALALA